MTIKSKDMIATTGKVRDALATALVRAGEGNLSSIDGRNMIGLANQITRSMVMEIKYQTMQISLGNSAETFGMVNIGESKRTKI